MWKKTDFFFLELKGWKTAWEFSRWLAWREELNRFIDDDLFLKTIRTSLEADTAHVNVYF